MFLMGSIEVSVIIVNYNTVDLLSECIKSIYEQTEDVVFEIIVVDNNSDDGSEGIVNENFPNVVFIQSGNNLGFGRANNLGIERSKGIYIFMLNPDTLLLNNALKVFLDFYRNNESILSVVGAVGGELLQIDGITRNHSSQSFPKMVDELKTIVNLLFLKVLKRPFFMIEREAILSDSEPFKEVDYVTGADLFISRDLILEFGCFDSKYFMYFEETDLQRRLVNAGYRNYLIRGTKIKHFEGGSFGKGISSYRKYMLDESRFYYYRKHKNMYAYLIFRMAYFMMTLPLIFDFRLTLKNRVDLLLLRLGISNFSRW
jgi:GT2 family glycosyltransferase